MRLPEFLIVALFFCLAGCSLEMPTVPSPEVTAEVTPTAAPLWVNANEVMSGICFESAFDAAGRVFVLRDQAALDELYNLADNSELCRQAVTRQPFDFNNGRILAGLWSSGVGCEARHDVLGVERDDDAKIVTMRLRFVTTGECSYELVRPFWVGLNGVAGYEVQIVVE